MAMMPPLLRGGISQMTSRAARSSLKAPPAPKRSVTVPSRVAMTPGTGSRELATMPWMASAALSPMSPSHLGDDASLGGVVAEEEPGQGNADEQEGRDREDRVVREGGAEARRVVLVPVLERLLQHARRCRPRPIDPPRPIVAPRTRARRGRAIIAARGAAEGVAGGEDAAAAAGRRPGDRPAATSPRTSSRPTSLPRSSRSTRRRWASSRSATGSAWSSSATGRGGPPSSRSRATRSSRPRPWRPGPRASSVCSKRRASSSCSTSRASTWPCSATTSASDSGPSSARAPRASSSAPTPTATASRTWPWSCSTSRWTR